MTRRCPRQEHACLAFYLAQSRQDTPELQTVLVFQKSQLIKQSPEKVSELPEKVSKV